MELRSLVDNGIFDEGIFYGEFVMNSITIKSVTRQLSQDKIYILMSSKLSEETREETIKIIANVGFLDFKYRDRRGNRTELVVMSHLKYQLDEFLERFMIEIYPLGESNG